MKFLHKLLAGLILFTISFSCKKDVKEEVHKKVTFNFGMSSNDVALLLNDTAQLNADYDVSISTFKFYVSDVTVVDAQGNETMIKDVALVFIGDKENPSSFTANLPSGAIKEIRFGIGVDAQQNNADPISFPKEHPLAGYQGMYWSMLKYRFAVLEGSVQSIHSTDYHQFAYHTGTDPLYRQKMFEVDFNNSSNALAYTIDLEVDLPTLFDGPGGKIDFTTQTTTHSNPSNIYIAKIIMDNLQGALKLKPGVSEL